MRMNANGKKLRIVVADDHELVRRGVKELLQDERGWKVVGEAANGLEALELVKKLKPDVAILDITMPVKDGLEATRLICEAGVGTHVLVLSIHESDQMVRRVLEAGARGCVLKTDMARHLVKVVKDVARGEISLTPRVSEIVYEGFLKVRAEEKPPGNSHGQPTPREIEVIRLLTEGKANKEIAYALGIAVRTVETHRARIMMKLGCHSLTELIRYALRDKIVTTLDT